MEADTQPGAPSADTSDGQPSSQGDLGVSGSSGAERSEASRAFNDLIRGHRSGTQTVTSEAGAATADTGGSAPTLGDERPGSPDRGADGRFIPRRGLPKAIEERDSKIAELERQVAERDPEKLRQQWAAETTQRAEESELQKLSQARAADVEKYRRLRDERDEDLSADDYAWREDFKAKLRSAPEAEAAHREYARQEIESARGELSARQEAFWDDVRGQMAPLASRPNVDAEAFRKLGRFDQMGDALYEAGRVSGRGELAEENRRLREENQQLRLHGPRGISAARAPLNGGAPSADAPMSPNEWFRRQLRGEPTG